MPSDGDSSGGCIIVVDECVPARLAERITRELGRRVKKAIAVAWSVWQGFKDRMLAQALIEAYCAKGWNVIFITRDWRWKKSAKLREQGGSLISVVKVDRNVHQSDVWGTVGSQIIGDVKGRLNRLAMA
ncbi:hypothetical protein HY624_02660 [Candidatus Uhrbacteria bacterium]|nr:hypothetical protein [Candidatus Uhrbacteria bacterium]